MLPYPHDLMKMAGLDPVKVFSSIQGNERRVDAKTLRNWLERKTTPRDSAVQRFLENLVSKVVETEAGTGDAHEIQAQITKAAALEDTRLSPLFEKSHVKLPMGRWLDALRQDKPFSSDKALGEFLLPNYDPENAKREVKRWRKGTLPPWKTVLKFPFEDQVQVFIVFACIQILHVIYNELNGPNSDDIGMDSTTGYHWWYRTIFKPPFIQAMILQCCVETILQDIGIIWKVCLEGPWHWAIVCDMPLWMRSVVES